MSRLSIQQILDKKKNGEKITMLTAYDYPFAALVDQAGMDIILVGDSLANVVLGLESTREVGMAEMLVHAKAVSRAVKHALVVDDMPFESYQEDPQRALENARRFIDEAGCDAVKLEWFEHAPDVARALTKAGIPVMGHVGLTPQTAEALGGFKVQGKEASCAQKIIGNAQALEKSGVFSLVLECIPAPLAAMITENVTVPTIGIGAGASCDGQVLVLHDVLGLCDRYKPKFVKQYVNLAPSILEGLIQYRNEVREGKFPDAQHSYAMKEEEQKKLKRA